jgi:hypothetical protein
LASDLAAEHLAQVDDADEYMVFKGMYDSVDGIAPGYLAFISSAQQVFTISGYQADADDRFGLVAQTIREGNAPTQYGDYSRIELSSDGSLGSADAPDPAQSTDNGREFCTVEPAVEIFDDNGDGV